MAELNNIRDNRLPEAEEDAAFDAYLAGILPEEADAGISRHVSPWHRSMSYILIGLALSVFNLHFYALDLILPALSFAFGLLGWMGLRHENRGFYRGWILMLLRTGVFLLGLFQNMTVWPAEDLLGEAALPWLQVFYAVLPILQLFALRRGIALLQEKAKLPEKTGAVSGLIVWYIILALLAFLRAEGLVVIVMLVIMAVCLVKISRLTDTMEEAGYLIEPSPARLRPAAMLGLYFGILILGCVLSFLLFSRYPMKWKEKTAALSAPAMKILSELKEMGFPEEVLKDLTEEDLLRCEGASDVMTKETSIYGRTDGLIVRSVAVVLSESPRIWQIFYHFSLPDQDRYWGTESLELRPLSLFGAAARIREEPHGYLFAEEGGSTKTAPISRIRYEGYTERNGNTGVYRNGWFASFSPPSSLRDFRGYVTVKVQNIYEGIDFSWPTAWNLIRERCGTEGLVYTHQVRPLQFPVLSARQYAKQNSLFDPRTAFDKLYIESWFLPDQSDPPTPQTVSTSP